MAMSPPLADHGARDRGGLALPAVVRELLRDPTILRWHPEDEVYEVMHGDKFEQRCWRACPCGVCVPVRLAPPPALRARAPGLMSPDEGVHCAVAHRGRARRGGPCGRALSVGVRWCGRG